MVKTLAAFFSLFYFTCCYSQIAPLRISPELTVSLPALRDTSQLKEVTIYSSNTDSIYYQVGMDRKPVTIKTKEDFLNGLKGFQSGFSHKLANYTVVKTDTIIGGVEGLFAYAVSKDTWYLERQLYMFYTIVNEHLYFIQCSTFLTESANPGVKQFFNSVKFTGDNYPDSPETSDSNSIAFKIGEV
jgi:hypothetical protein